MSAVSSAKISLINLVDIVALKKGDLVITNLKGKVVLDAGCGTGSLSAKAAKRGFIVIAIDLSKKQLAISKELFRKENVHIPLVRASLTHIPFKNFIFDSIMCLDVIEHVPAVGLVFSEFYRILTYDGKLCITTPNGYGCYGILFDFILRKLFFLSYFSKTSRMLRRKEIETYHVHKFTPGILQKLAWSYNFKIVQFYNIEFLTALWHIVFSLILKSNVHLARIQKLDLDGANRLPLIMGSEWFLCLAKLSE